MSLKKVRVPTVKINAPAGREYTITLQQTKHVFDELLANKMAKIMKDLFAKKDQLDKKCEDIASKRSHESALEYAVIAQEELNKMHQTNMGYLQTLTVQYQQNLDKVQKSLEETYVQNQNKKVTAL